MNRNSTYFRRNYINVQPITMKNLLLLLGMISFINPVNNPQLTIKITNIEKVKGEIIIGVFNIESSFLKVGKALKSYSIKVSKDAAIVTITDLPKGEYAISMYQDVNSDSKMNTNIIGIPKEAYGFSNNIKPVMSPPKYKDCKFGFSENKTLEIKMIN